MPIIAQERVDKNGEITLADSINELANTDEVYGRFIEGVWHDTGDQLKYLMAVVDHALLHPKLKNPLAAYLKNRLNQE